MELSVFICRTPWDERGPYQVRPACTYEFSCEHSPEILFLLGWESGIVAAAFSLY